MENNTKEKEFFYVRPTNSILLEQNNNVSSVDIDNIKGLVNFALTLKSDDLADPSSYITALADYYTRETNKYYGAYSKLCVSHFGLSFLCTCIKLSLLERIFREVGIDEKLAQVYNNELTEYNGQIQLNKAMFDQSTMAK